jgi:hypothetical protein
VESSTFFVFDSQPNFRSNNIRFQFIDCYSQSRPNRHRYQIFLFRGDAARLSIATCYGASKSYSSTHNLITTIESSCDGSLSGLRFRARFEPSDRFGGFLLPLNPIWESSTPLDATSSLGKTVVPCLKTYQDVLLFKTLPPHHFERVFPRLFAGSPFSPTLSLS